jgi:hypothetical protein
MRARSDPYRSHWLCGLHDPLSVAERLLNSEFVVSSARSDQIVPTQEKEKKRPNSLQWEDQQRSAIAEGSLVDLIQ